MSLSFLKADPDATGGLGDIESSSSSNVVTMSSSPSLLRTPAAGICALIFAGREAYAFSVNPISARRRLIRCTVRVSPPSAALGPETLRRVGGPAYVLLLRGTLTISTWGYGPRALLIIWAGSVVASFSGFFWSSTALFVAKWSLSRSFLRSSRSLRYRSFSAL